MKDSKVVLSENQLSTLVKDLAKEIWNDNLSVPVMVSKKMTSVFGYFLVRGKGKSAKADKLMFADRMLHGDYKLSTIVDIIKHELTHYKLFIDGVSGYQDKNWEFENELRRIGAHSTRTITNPGEQHIGKCSCCGNITSKGTEKKVRSRCNTTRWISKCCRAMIVYAGEQYIEDNTQERMALETCYRMENLQSVKKFMGIKNSFIPTPEYIPNENKTRKVASVPALTNELKIEDIIQIPNNGKVTGNKIFKTVVQLLKDKEVEKLILINNIYPTAMAICINEKYLGKTRFAYAKTIGL